MLALRPSQNGIANPGFPRFDLEDFFGPLTARGNADVWEDDEAFHVEVDVPGAKEGDVEVTTEGSEMIIRAATPCRGDDGKVKWHSRRRRADVRCDVRLPDAADVSKAEASLKAGVLSIMVPKSEGSRPRKLGIKILD